MQFGRSIDRKAAENIVSQNAKWRRSKFIDRVFDFEVNNPSIIVTVVKELTSSLFANVFVFSVDIIGYFRSWTRGLVSRVWLRGSAGNM